MLHRCAINVFVLQCVRNPLAMCFKCVTNVLQMWPPVCALQFAMKVIWWRGSEATICRIGQSRITIVMRSGKQVETTFWTLKRKDLIHIIRELFDGDIWSWHLRGDTVEAPPHLRDAFLHFSPAAATTVKLLQFPPLLFGARRYINKNNNNSNKI